MSNELKKMNSDCTCVRRTNGRKMCFFACMILLLFSVSVFTACGSERREKGSSENNETATQGDGTVKTTENDEESQLVSAQPETGDGPVVLDIYEHPVYEQLALNNRLEAEKYTEIRLSETKSNAIKEGIDGIDYWLNNAMLDRMPYWFDAKMSIDSDDYAYYIDFAIDVLVKTDGSEMYIAQMDNELSALVISQCAGRNVDIAKNENGTLSESGACDLALRCMKQLAEGNETDKVSEKDTVGDYYFGFETTEEKDCYRMTVKKRNDIYTHALFLINYKKGSIKTGYVSNSLPEEAVMPAPVSYEELPLSKIESGEDFELYTDGHYNYIFNGYGHIAQIVPVIDYAAPEVNDAFEDAKAYVKRLYPQLELKDEHWGSMGDDCEKGYITVYYEYPLEEYYSVNIITMRYGEDDMYKRLIGAEFHMELLKYLDYADDIVLPTVINEKAEKWLRTYLTENGDETNSTYIKEPKKYLYHPKLEIDPSGKAVWKVAFEHIDRGRLTDNSVSAYYVIFDAFTGEYVNWYAELDTDG